MPGMSGESEKMVRDILSSTNYRNNATETETGRENHLSFSPITLLSLSLLSPLLSILLKMSKNDDAITYAAIWGVIFLVVGGTVSFSVYMMIETIRGIHVKRSATTFFAALLSALLSDAALLVILN